MPALADTLRRLRQQAGAAAGGNDRAPKCPLPRPVQAIAAAKGGARPCDTPPPRIPPVADPALRRLLEARLLRQGVGGSMAHGRPAASAASPVRCDPRDRALPGREIAPGLHLVEHWPGLAVAADTAVGLDDDLPAIAAAAGAPVARASTAATGSTESAGAQEMDLPRLAARNITGGCARAQLLFFDTETTGLAGGTGTRAFMVGAADWQHGRLRVRQLMLSRLGAEAAMLEAFRSWLADDTVLVSYNGRCYDAPLLATRYRLARLSHPLAVLPHLDLLHAVRRRYRGVWENCRLATVECQLLGVVREDDLPGSEAPAAFLGYLRGGGAGTLRRVLAHNQQDVLTLAQLLDRLLALPTGATATAANANDTATATAG